MRFPWRFVCKTHAAALFAIRTTIIYIGLWISLSLSSGKTLAFVSRLRKRDARLPISALSPFTPQNCESKFRLVVPLVYTVACCIVILNLSNDGKILQKRDAAKKTIFFESFKSSQ